MNNAFLLAITLGCMILLSSCQISTQIEYPQCSTPTFRLFPIIGEIRVYLFSDPATTIVYEHDPRGNIPRDPHQNSPIYDDYIAVSDSSITYVRALAYRDGWANSDILQIKVDPDNIE